jgi:hypothetical protein
MDKFCQQKEETVYITYKGSKNNQHQGTKLKEHNIASSIR